MSIWRTSYLIYGFRLDKESEIEVIDDHYEELMKKEPYLRIFDDIKSDQAIIEDYMCGDYVYIGIMLAEVDGDDWCEISDSNMSGLKDKLNQYILEWPDYLRNVIKDKESKLYMFIHAS